MKRLFFSLLILVTLSCKAQSIDAILQKKFDELQAQITALQKQGSGDTITVDTAQMTLINTSLNKFFIQIKNYSAGQAATISTLQKENAAIILRLNTVEAWLKKPL